jgi:hypothetical protein
MFLQFSVFALSLSAQTASGPLPPLAPAYGQIAPTFWEQYGIATVIGSLAFIAWAGFIYWLFFRPQPPLTVPPDVSACGALTRLSRVPEDGKVLSEISQTLRRYIIAAFGLPAGELTTGEFTTALASDEKIDVKLALSTANLLRECDERKFSPANPRGPLNAAGRALEIVWETEKQRARALAKK